MKKHSYKLPERSAKKDFVFNMFGSTANAAVSVLLLVIVSHLAGETGAGIFSLCFTTAQMMYTVAAFELRNIQVTDAKREFTFSDVLTFRFITIIVMLIASAVVVAVRGFSGTKAVLTLLLCLYMAMLSVSDVFEGNLHRNGYLFLAGTGLGCEVFLAAVAFSATLAITGNLIVSVIPMIAVIILWVCLFDIPFSNNFSGDGIKLRPKIIKKLFFATLPLFLSVFLNQFAFNTPKYAIDDYLTEIDQSHYGFLIMPAFFINLLSIFVFRPQLVSLAEKWNKKDFSGFKKTVTNLYVWVVAATVFAMIAGFVFGIPVLNILYNTHLNDYRGLFMLLLLGGGFSAGSTLSVTMLAVIRKQKYGIIAYIITAVLAAFLPGILVRKIGFAGAVYSYVIEMAVLFAALFTIFVGCYLLFGKKEGE